MRVNIQNMLRQAGHAIPSHRDTGAYSYVLQQLSGHLLQLRNRTQAGDLTALDEFFKLYVFDDGKDYARSLPVCTVCGGKGRIDTIRIGNTVNIPCPECSAKETPAEEFGECPTCRAGTASDGRRVHLSLCPATNR